MSSLLSWLQGAGPPGASPVSLESYRAIRAWNRILDNPSSVAFRRPDGAILSAQTVRLESDNSATIAESVAGAAPRRKLIVFGVRNHPVVADTDLAEGYRFNHAGDMYTIVDLIETLGEVQAVAEAIG